jgi:hypothetical protein
MNLCTPRAIRYLPGVKIMNAQHCLDQSAECRQLMKLAASEAETVRPTGAKPN